METKTKMEKRELFQPGSINIREAAEGGAQVIEGDAIMCGVETVLYEDEDVREVEVIDASCIRPDFIARQDMFINAQHKREKTFGRQGANLTVVAREDRVSCSCTGTSDLFRETRALISDGVYTGMSFEFWPKDYTITKREGADGKAEYLIRHTAFEAIGALTVAMTPAYKQTSVNARELYRELEEEATPEVPVSEPDPDEEERQVAQEEAAAQAAREKLTRERTLRALQSDIDAERALMNRK